MIKDEDFLITRGILKVYNCEKYNVNETMDLFPNKWTETLLLSTQNMLNQVLVTYQGEKQILKTSFGFCFTIHQKSRQHWRIEESLPHAVRTI